MIVEGAVFDLPDRLDESLTAEPTLGQHIVCRKHVLDGPLDHGNRLGNFVSGAFLAPDGSRTSGVAGFPILLLALAPPASAFLHEY